MKNLKFGSFFNRVNNAASKQRFPLEVTFELTYKCNFRCIHCYLPGKNNGNSLKKEIGLKDVVLILEQLRDMGCYFLTFTGGEIFTRLDIMDIIWSAKRMGFNISILTNGSLITESIADALRRIRPNKVDISFYSHKKETFDKITRTNRSYTRVLRAVNLLKDRSLDVTLKTCGMSYNKKDLVGLSRLAREMNLPFMLSGALIPKLNGSKTPLRYLLSFRQIENYRKACYPEMYGMADTQKKKKLKIAKWAVRRNLNRLFTCQAGYTTFSISPFGELKTCLLIDYPNYNILAGSSLEGWELVKNFIDNVKPSKDFNCKNCELVNYCSWCPAMGYIYKGDLNACSPVLKKQARFRRDLSQKLKNYKNIVIREIHTI